MRELRTCDFCDGDAAGTFEIVPPELEPTESEQRRAVLCPACRDRLEGLLEPLLARARNGAPADGTEPDATGDERSDGGGSAATAPATADAADPDPDSGSATATADADDADASLEDGITFERDERGSATETVADAADGETDRGDDGEDGTATGSSDRPAAYAKVVRLLRNREFPMDRSAVEELAAGAYDLEGREVEAIVDRAVAEGEFTEEGGTLRRP